MKPQVAAFDFDGTITRRDSFLFFLWKNSKPFPFIINLLKSTFPLLLFLFGKIGRQPLKEKYITLFFKGETLEKMEQRGNKFAEEELFKIVKKSALKKIEWHRKRGDRLILISASLDIYLKPWAKEQGFHDTLSSLLEIDSQSRVTGKLLGKNCRGQEKVSQLKKLIGEKENYELWAYGDSDGDEDLLQFADHQFYSTFK